MTRHLAAVPDPVASMPEVISYSQASTFDGCPKRWFAQYVSRVPDPVGPDALRGSLAHALLEHLAALPPGSRTAKALRTIAARVFADADPTLARQALALTVPVSRLPIMQEATVVDREVKFHTVVAGVPFRGAIDRVDQLRAGFAVLDYKFGKPTPTRFRDKEYRQIRLYTAALTAIGERVPVVAGGILWGRDRTLEPVDVDADVVAEAVDWLVDVWTRLAAAVESQRFEATPGNLCSWCPVVANCSAGQAATIDRAREKRSVGPHGLAWLGVPDGSTPTQIQLAAVRWGSS